MNHCIICFPAEKMSWGGEGGSLLAIPAQSFSSLLGHHFTMVPLRSSPVTSSSLPSRQLLNDPLHSRMSPLGVVAPHLPAPRSKNCSSEERSVSPHICCFLCQPLSRSLPPGPPSPGDSTASGRASSICTMLPSVWLCVSHGTVARASDL